MKSILIIATILLISTNVFCQFYGGGGGPNAFYFIQFSPREIAMGNTGVASANGVFASYWNPANMFDTSGLGTVRMFRFGLADRGGANSGKTSWGFKTTQPIIVIGAADYRWQASSFLFIPVKAIAVGLGYNYRRVDNIIPTTLESGSDEIVEEPVPFNYNEAMLRLSGALNNIGNTGIDLGMNWRCAMTDFLGVFIGEVRNVDIGFRGRHGDFSVGASANIDYNRGTDRGSQFRYNWGLSYSILSNSKTELLLSHETNVGNFTPLTLGFGGEYIWKLEDVNLSGRGGVRIGKNSNPQGDGLLLKELSLGLGTQWQHEINFSVSWQIYCGDENQYESIVDPPLKFGIEIIMPF